MKSKLMGVLLVLVAGATSQRLEHEIALPSANAGALSPSVLLFNPADTTLWVGASPYLLVLKPVTGEWAARIRVPEGGRSMCLNPVRNKVYIGEGYDSVIVADGATGSAIACIPTYSPPSHLAHSRATDRVFSAGDDSLLTIIDCAGDSVMGQVGLNSYVDDISAPSCSMAGVVSVPGGAAPIVYSRRHDRPYCGVGIGGLAAIDCSTLHLTSIPSTGSTSGLLLDTIADKLYSLSGAWIQVIDCNTNLVLENLSIGDNGGAMAWDPVNRRVYVTIPEASEIVVLYDSTIAAIAEAPGAKARTTRMPTIVRGYWSCRVGATSQSRKSEACKPLPHPCSTSRVAR